MDLDEAIAMLIDLLQRSQASGYGYDLYPRRGAEEAALRLQPHDPYRREKRCLAMAFIL
jgi:hypothetical protein